MRLNWECERCKGRGKVGKLIDTTRRIWVRTDCEKCLGTGVEHRPQKYTSPMTGRPSLSPDK